MQWYILNDHSTRAAFQSYWRREVQGLSLVDILGLPMVPWLPLTLYWKLILRTAVTDMGFVVDTAGARVEVGAVEVEAGHEVQSPLFNNGKGKTSGYWERVEPDMVGQQIGDIEFFDTPDRKHPYCHKVIIAFERHRLILEDVQDRMNVEVSPQFFTTGW